MIRQPKDNMRFTQAIILILFCIGCTETPWEETIDTDPFPPGVIRFQSVVDRVLTMQGEEQIYFDPHTLFRIYATYDAEGNPWTTTDAQVENLFDAVTCATPSGRGGMDYRSYNGDSTALYNGKSVTTYGVTFNRQATVFDGDNKPVVEDFEWPTPDDRQTWANEAPCFTITADSVTGKLPDLMRGYSGGRRVSDGIFIPMQFDHTLSRIRFEVLKDTKLADKTIRIKKIILNLPTRGTFDLGKNMGKYMDQNPYFNLSESDERVVFDGSMTLPANKEDMLAHHLLIFPMSKKTAQGPEPDFTVDYTLEVEELSGEITEVERQASLPLYDFRPNKDYLITLMCVGGEVRLVIFSPKVYDWVESKLNDDPDYTISQLINFGGTTWMDRNLGAKSADCVNDWDNTRGAYYQFGRNIPYIFDKEKWDNDYKNIPNIKSNGNYTYQGRPREDIYFYTINQHGNRVYEAYNIGGSGSTDNTTNAYNVYAAQKYNINTLAVNPGDDKQYYGIVITMSKTWMFANPGYSFYYADIRNYWNTVDKHPCPKGWKLPAKEDMVSFLPDPMMSNTNSSAIGGNGIWNNTTGYYYRDEQIRGTVLNDRSSRIVAGRNLLGYPSFYMLKNIGITGQEYFIRMRRMTTGTLVTTARTTLGNVEQGYFEFCRYAANASDIADFNIANLNTKDKFESNLKFGREGTFWDSPQERMLIPACGVIGLATSFTTSGSGASAVHTVTATGDDAGLFGDGHNVRLRTSDANNYYQGYLCFFQQVANGNMEMGLKDVSTYGAGAQIRCVRDLNAQ